VRNYSTEDVSTKSSRIMAKILLRQDKGLTFCASVYDRQHNSRFFRIVEAFLDFWAIALIDERNHCEASWWRETHRGWYLLGEIKQSALTDLLLMVDACIVTVENEQTTAEGRRDNG